MCPHVLDVQSVNANLRSRVRERVVPPNLSVLSGFLAIQNFTFICVHSVRYLLVVQSDNHLGKQQPKTLLSDFCRAL
jgi:hypothetical protein